MKAIPLLVVVLGLLPWAPLLRGQYLYDDISLVETNARLKEVRRLADVPRFVLKPSKPVSNVLLALGQWLGGGKVGAQRALSLAIHAASAVFLYLILAEALPPFGALIASVAFAWLPLHAESLAIAWFRMDAAATCLALAAAWLGRKQKWGPALFLCLMSALTKETFVLLAPIALWASTGHRRALAVAVPAAILVGVLLPLDAVSDYPYGGVVGAGVARPPWLGLIAAGEWFVKAATGLWLSKTPLFDRWSTAGFGPAAWALAGLGGAGTALLLSSIKRPEEEARWAAAAGSALLLYGVIPNVNVGAERYGYFPAAAAVIALARFLNARLHRRGAAAGAAVLYALALLVPVHRRVAELETRFSLAAAEAGAHPEVAVNWSDVALAALELPGDAFLPAAKGYLDEALKLDPIHPRVRLAQFQWLFRTKDIVGYRALLAEWESRFSAEPRTSAGLRFQLGVLEAEAAQCEQAEESFSEAARRDRRLASAPRPACS